MAKAPGLILLWLELKKLALAGVRLAAGLFLVLAVLNLGLGAAALVDVSPVSSGTQAQGGVAAWELLHLQFFGFWHVHEELNQTENTPPGVTEYDTGMVPTAPLRFSYLTHGTRLDSDYSSGSLQKSLTDFPDPHHLGGVAALQPVANQPLSNDSPIANPFLKIPLKPPIP